MDPSIAELKITRRSGQSDEELHAEQLAEGVNSNAFLALLFAQHSGFAKGSEIGELVGATQQAVSELSGEEPSKPTHFSPVRP